MSAPIFISYSSKDQDIAETICRALEARGQRCWISARDVHAGENFQEAIVRALRTAKVMLLVFTANANNSDEIKKELVLAGRHQVTVVPIRVEDVVPNDAFTYEFATRQWVDLFKDWEREIELLVTRIGHLLEAGQDGAAAPPPMPLRTAPRSRAPLLWIGAAALALVALIGAVMLYLRPAAKQVAAATAAAPSQIAAPMPAAVAAATPAPAVLSPVAAPAPATPAVLSPALPAVAPSAPLAAAPAVAPAPPQSAAALEPAPPPQTAALTAPSSSPASSTNSDDLAWQAATSAATTAAFAGYLKDFPAGAHVQNAQLKMADLIMAGTTAAGFDGRWETTWTCTNVGQFPGYSFRFTGEVKGGAYHGQRGAKGEPGSLDLNGKIMSDGKAAFFGEVIVNSPLVGMGAARGTPSDFHVIGHFEKASGSGTRIEGRPCSITFSRQ